MRDWNIVIKKACEENLITEKEAEDLLRTYGLAKEGKWIPTKGFKTMFKSLKDPKNRMTLLLAGSLLAPTVGVLATAVSRPAIRLKQYAAMKKQLERIAPDIIKKYDDKHLKAVFTVVNQFAPIIASNPVTAAIAVRDNIQVPSQIDLLHLKAMTDIQHKAPETLPVNIGKVTAPLGKKIVETVSGEVARAAIENMGM